MQRRPAEAREGKERQASHCSDIYLGTMWMPAKAGDISLHQDDAIQ